MIRSIKISVILGFIFLIASCGGGSSQPKIQATTELSTNQMAFTFSDSKALLLSDSSTTYETELGPVTTNLSKILENGTLAPAFLPSSSDSLSSATIRVSYFTYSPIGDVHIKFNSSVTVDSENCSWIVIKSDNQVSCVSTLSLSFNSLENNLTLMQASSSGEGSITDNISDTITQLEFDALGNAFYSTEFGNKIYKWNREDGSTSTIFDGDPISFEVYKFLVASDESLMISGVLQGTGEYEEELFRYVPSSGLSRRCDNSDFFISSTGTLYVYGSCTNGETAIGGLLIGSFADGELTFTEMESGGTSVDLGGSFYESSSGDIYTYNYDDTVTWLNVGAFEEISIEALTDTALSEVKGDYFYQTGTDTSGNYVFIRKHLVGEREEIDLLGGADLLVQQFDITDEGDVYFGALDLNTTQVYLYKYNNSTGELETVESLSSDLSQIITL